MLVWRVADLAPVMHSDGKRVVIMNELSTLISKLRNGDTLTLEGGRVYTVAPENSFHLFGIDFSNTAKESGNPDGERFCGIYLENKNHVTVDGNGATVLIHGIMTPFLFRNCADIVLKNLTFDHYRPTMSEFTVLENERGRVRILIRPEFRYRIDGNGIIWLSEDSDKGRPYWELPYRADCVVNAVYHPEKTSCRRIPSLPEILSVTEIVQGELEIVFRDGEFPYAPGDVLQSRNMQRVQTGGAVDGCRNVTLQDLRMMSFNCFGIVFQNTENVSLLRLDCTPKEGRTCTSDADFFHFSGCSGEIRIDSCRASGAHDDIMNIHGTHLRIVGTDKTCNKVILRYVHPESWGFEPYAPGEEVEFVSGNTLLPYCAARVLCVRKLSRTDFEVIFDCLPERIPAPNDVVENVTRTAALTVENCEFSSIPTRGILCTTRKDVLIRKNVFRSIYNPVLLIADDANFWFESGRSGKVRFEENTVIDCGMSEGQAVVEVHPEVLDGASREPVHEQLEVINNRFINTAGEACTVKLHHLKTARFEGNEWNTDVRYETDAAVHLTGQ